MYTPPPGGLAPRGGEPGADVAGQHGADADPVGPDLVLQREDIGVYRGLADRIPELEWYGQYAGYGAHADYPPATAGAHVRKYGADGVVGAEEVELELGVGIGGVGELSRAGYAEAGVADEYVYAPGEGRGGVYRPPDRPGVGDVAADVLHPVRGMAVAGKLKHAASGLMQG